MLEKEKTIEVNRGDRKSIKLISKKGNFEVGKHITFSIVEKKNYNNVIFQKTYTIFEDSNEFVFTLTKQDTTIGEIISKKVVYWYEIEYDGDQTIIGYDKNKGKEFILYPEAPKKGSDN